MSREEQNEENIQTHLNNNNETDIPVAAQPVQNTPQQDADVYSQEQRDDMEDDLSDDSFSDPCDTPMDPEIETNKKLMNKKPKLETLDEENFYEPLDATQEGVYLVKEFDENTAKYRWKLTNVNSIKKGVYSPVFFVGGYPWRFFVFPNGNNSTNIAVYLDIAEDEYKKTNPSTETWVRYCRFLFSLLNIKDIRRSHSQEAEKRFLSADKDWGFSNFIDLSRIKSEEGFFSPENNGTMYFEVVVHVSTEPYLLHPHQYDSKSETGFVGIKNQGATCYLNSLLQSWFHVPYLRKAVYSMPIEDQDKPEKSIPLALQRVFFRLQNEKVAVDTKELTKSFGWDTIDSFMQHDVQELSRVLGDNLEKKMDKIDDTKGTMKYLLEGSIKNYIKCLNVPYESSRIETFYDLQLNVKGCKDVSESFAKYVEDETLSGENQYRAENFGLQDARKGCKFIKFPPLLTLHLRRFEYDFMRDVMCKINDRYEFPVDLDLNEFVDADVRDKMDPDDNRFTLFSVLVHQGDVSGGHYYAFIRPNVEQGDWYKFDDEKVFKVSAREAIEDNFGGQDDKKSRFFWRQSTNTMYKRFTNAYMLVYVRKKDALKILAPIAESDVPKHLEERINMEKLEHERLKQEESEQWKYTYIRVATEADLRNHHDYELMNFETIQPIKIKKTSRILDLKEEISKKLNIAPERQRFWKWEHRQNKTYRPESCLNGVDEKSIESVFKLGYHKIEHIDLFLEESKQKSADSPLFETDPEKFLIFFKFYTPESKLLQYVGYTFVHKSEKLESLVPTLQEMAQLPPDTPISAYEELKVMRINLLNLSASLAKAEIQTGDIIAYQAALNPDEPQPPFYELPCKTVVDYYVYLSQRVNVSFYNLDNPDHVEIELELLKNFTYQHVAQALGARINQNPDYIRFTGQNPFLRQDKREPRKQPFRTTDVKTLKDMLHFSTAQALPCDTLYYEILEVPIQEIEEKKEVNLNWYNSKVEFVKKYKIILPKDKFISDLHQILVEKLANDGIQLTKPIAMFGVDSFKIIRVYYPTDPVTQIDDKYDETRAEEKTDEELLFEKESFEAHQHNKERTLFHVLAVHFCRENMGIRYFGNPFILFCTKNQTVQDVKQIIQQRLDVKEEEFKKYKFAPLVGLQRQDYLKDEEPLLEAIIKHNVNNRYTVLGIEHKDTTTKHTTRWYDKPIVIKDSE